MTSQTQTKGSSQKVDMPCLRCINQLTISILKIKDYELEQNVN